MCCDVKVMTDNRISFRDLLSSNDHLNDYISIMIILGALVIFSDL